MKARNPVDGLWYYMIDKNLPFGASISCSHFQRVSNGISHIMKYRSSKENVNYLDDFLFAAIRKLWCDQQIQMFINICDEIGLPINVNKTFWGTTYLVFLGLLINTITQTVSVPMEKLEKGLNLINSALDKKSRKITLYELQQICGFLNFLGKAIVPGRAFTRRLYACQISNLKPYHHLKITGEMKQDLLMWKTFLQHPSAFCRQ